jgi:hypothetical protein
VAASESLHARQAALFLHGLPCSVREQVLVRLPASESSRLQPLLNELAALGIPKSQAAAIERLGAALPQPRTAVERAERLQPEQVLRSIESCTASTVALLLRGAQWPWKDEVIHRMSDALRSQVLQGSNAEYARPAPAVLRVLCECLCRDAAAPAVAHPRPFGESPASGLESIRADFHQLGTRPWPVPGTWRNGAGVEMGAAAGIGKRLRRLFRWNR